MIGDRRVLAIIPARGGSKGVPRKNIRMAGGKPLIAWSIEAALKSKYLDRLILSSEDAEIIDVARSLGCEVPFVRPLELAGDQTPGIDTVLHALSLCPGYDYVVLLQPTSPLREVSDIDGCLEQMAARNARCMVTVTEPEKSPYWMFALDAEGHLNPLLACEGPIDNRQQLPKVFALNGAVYLAQVDWLLENKSFLSRETIAYPMPRERSLDIDTALDLDFLDFLVHAGGAHR